MAEIRLGESTVPGSANKLGERLGGEKAPMPAQSLPDDLQQALRLVPIHPAFERIHRRNGSQCSGQPGWRELVVRSVWRPEQAINGADSASPFGSACSQFRVALKLEPRLAPQKRLSIPHPSNGTTSRGVAAAGIIPGLMSGNPLQDPGNCLRHARPAVQAAGRTGPRPGPRRGAGHG
jgi:hypothetical protein